MTKTTLLLSVPILLGLTLSGCIDMGGGGGGGSGKDSETINIAIVSDNVEYDTMNTFIAAYKKISGNENKKFKVVRADYADYIYNSFMYNELADIIQVFDYNCEYYTNVPQNKNGDTLLQSISSYMQRDGISESVFFDSVVEMTKCKNGSNEMYWVPRDYNKVVCAYNKGIFDAAGLQDHYPTDNWTWSDFVATCELLKSKESEITAYTKSTTFYPVDLNMNFPAVYYPLLKSYGVELIDKTTEKCFGDKIDTAKTAWAKLLSMMDNGLANNKADKKPFTSKQAAMMFMVRPNLPSYYKGLGDVIDFVSLPTYEDLPEGATSYIGMGCSGYGMTTACPDGKKEAVWDFLKFIISTDGQNAFSESGSGIPSLKALATDANAAFKKYRVTDSYHPNHDAFIAHAERDIPMNFLSGFKVDKQITIDKYIKDRTLEQFYKHADDRDQYFIDYKNGMENIWK